MEVHVSGRWYLALAVAMGLVSLGSGNNLLYVFESFLLAGLMVSGVISERIVKKADVEFLPAQAIRGQSVADVWKVTNLGKTALFDLRLGFWTGGEFLEQAVLPYLKPYESKLVLSRTVYEQRGLVAWDQVCLATDFPFGFIRKIRPLGAGGTRLVWASPRQFNLATVAEAGNREESASEDLEIRWSDQMASLRRQVFGKDQWEQSTQAGQWIREFSPSKIQQKIRLEYDASLSSKQRELLISGAAHQITELSRHSANVVLEIHQNQKWQIFEGERSAQDALASL